MSFPEWANAHRAELEAFIGDRYLDAWPSMFGQAMRYPVFGGGKRFRPLLVMAAFESIRGKNEPLKDALPAATAIELIHTYSLVHDDLPCMDDDDIRRGRPTVHKQWDEATAVLSGDALLTDAFLVLADAPLDPNVRIALIRELAMASGYLGMIGGQAADIRIGDVEHDLPSVKRLHSLKTGALIRFAARSGGLSAGASEAQLELLDTVGTSIGLAFQLVDDLLDEEEDAADDGPPSFVKLLGREETQRRAQELSERSTDAARALPHPEALLDLISFTLSRDH